MRPLALVAAALFVVSACAGGGQPTGQPIGQPTGQPSPGATSSPAAPPAPTPAESPAGPTNGAATPSPDATVTARPGLGSGPFGWTELQPAGGPPAREDHTFTVDGFGERAYLFGGRAGDEAFADLWRYDLASDTWQQIVADGQRPPARFGHVAAWVEGVGLVIWSGQQSSDVFFGDIWAFDPITEGWGQLPDGGDVPPARYGSCGAIGPDGRLWISHGFTADTGRFDDTRAYDFDEFAWTDLTEAGNRPVIRCLHDCLWTPDGQFVLYAGQTTGAPAIGDLWSYDSDGGAWTEHERPTAPARQLYALAQVDQTAFIFGGGSADRGHLDDLWLLDLTTLAMTPAEVATAGPSARFGAALIADPARGRLLLFGGTGPSGALADTWQLTPAGP